MDDHKPAPVPHAHVLPEVSLADLDQLTLVSFLAKDVAADSFQNFALDLSDKFYHQLVPFFLKSSQCAGPEEDNGVSLNCNMKLSDNPAFLTEPVSLAVKVDLVHESID